jgi:uridine phosphorylase
MRIIWVMIRFDSDESAIFNPTSFGLDNFPSKALIVYDDDYFARLTSKHKLTDVVDSTGRKRDNFAIYNDKYLIMSPNEGAPTSVIMLEMAIVSGVKSVLAFGTAGSLYGETLPHEIIVPTAAVREEGTSYHYIPESDEIEQDKASLEVLKNEIQKHGLGFIAGKTWTTDAFFRETKSKVEEMKTRGCICVDMECSALIAICKFRNVRFAQFMISFDNLEADHKHRDAYGSLMNDAILDIAFGALDNLSK